jgi:outer membrane protein TolC
MKTISYFSSLFLFILSFPFIVSGQSSSNIFTQEEFIWFVKNYHPISVQGELLLEKGESAVRKARGGFDPYLYTSLDQKNFDDKNYYSLLSSGLKIPTWYGIEIKTGYDQNTGEFLDPQNNLPPGGLWYAGISVPIGQGLFIDKRRAALKQADFYAQSTESERQKLINDLYFDAMKTYWYWVAAWNQYKIYEESVELAMTRFEAVKQSYFLGDLPAIDTLEAFIQVQNRQMNRNEYQLEYQNISLDLSNFLWYEDNTPLVISDSLRPPSVADIELASSMSSDSLKTVLKRLADLHPEMQLYQYKLASMEVEARLKREALKPKLNLNYNAITEPLGSDPLGGFSAQNYKWGFEFSFPIFLRSQRGELQLTKLKIRDTELEQQQKLLELYNKMLSYYNEQENLKAQVALFIETVNNYDALLQGERQKFDGGESALFLVNSREINLIQAKVKLVELVAKYNISNVGLIWSTGTLFTL